MDEEGLGEVVALGQGGHEGLVLAGLAGRGGGEGQGVAQLGHGLGLLGRRLRPGSGGVQRRVGRG